MTGPLPKPGDTSLLLLADMLDKVDEQHTARGEPRYDQGAFVHPCGTPACAIGHWLQAEGKLATALTSPLNIEPEECKRLRAIFEITDPEWSGLFGGYFSATGQEEAARIRRFVRNRSSVKIEG